jgi:ATP-binding cassette, subfamily G (WHITE), member 2, SNQ2
VVLGSPGAGCSTFLKTLTNQTSEFHSLSGTLHYGSLSPSTLARHYRGDVQYCPEDDIHFPTLTVEQTIRFATSTRAPSTRSEGQSREEYVKLMTDVYVTLFGLRGVRGTRVGDQAIRGVSGGEKKRVSIAEALANRSLINAWDKSVLPPHLLPLPH